jgi:hypothetical protein
VAAPTAVCAAIGMAAGLPGGDWEIAREAGEILIGGGLDVYAQMPTAQMGPLALLLAGALPGWLYLALICALLPVILLLALANQAPTPRLYSVVTAGGILLAWPWVAFGRQGHADEALVVLGAAVMVVAFERHRSTWVVAAFLLAIAAKPTAVVLLPLVFMSSRRAGVTAVLGTALIWLPFFVADPGGFLAAGRAPGDMWPGSLHTLLGAEPYTGFPIWVRPVQLVGGLLLVWVLVRHRSAAAAVVGVFAFRALLEPGAWNYYGTAIAAAALLFDARNLRWPVVTALGAASFAAVLSTPISTLGGHVRLAAISIALVVVVVIPSRGRRRWSNSEESAPYAAPPPLRDRSGV